jgi:hypothetical protein
MEANATITWQGKGMRAKLSPLQAAEIAASKFGFFDVDLKDNDPGMYTIVCSAPKRTVTVKGKTLEQAVERLFDVFTND